MPENPRTLDGTSDPSTAWHSAAAGSPALVLGRYQLQNILGSGGMGTVYLAQHTFLKQAVAIKAIRFDRSPHHTAGLIERFRREMEAIGGLNHPHVVRATDGGEEAGLYYLVMEYIDGTDLEKLARRLGPLPVATACELVRQAALGLVAIHARGWVHRDLKPGNLLLTRTCQVKIADLGLVRFLTEVQEAGELTPPGGVIGTPDYMSPEQGRDASTADIRADIYSLGASLYRLVVGTVLYPAPRYHSATEKLLAHQQQSPPALPRAPGQSPPGRALGAVLKKLLAKDPRDRYADPDAVVAALTPLARGHNLETLWTRLTVAPPEATPVMQVATVSAHDATTAQQETPPPPTLSRRTLWRVGLGALGVTLAGGAAFWWLPRSEPQPDRSVVPVPPLDLDRVELKRWVKLLDRPPVPFLWRPDARTWWSHDDAAQEVTAQTSQLGMLELGRTAWPDFVVRILLEPAAWQSGVGLYLGCQLQPGEAGHTRFTVLELREQRVRQGHKQLNVTRTVYDLTRTPEGTYQTASVGIGSHLLREIKAELALEVTVTRGLISAVRVNAPLATDVVKVDALKADLDLPHTGGFGIFAGNSETRYRDAQYMRLPPLPE